MQTSPALIVIPGLKNMDANQFFLSLHIQPGARKSEWSGIHGDRIKLRLKAPPVEGKANEELLRFLKSELKAFGSCRLELVSGDKSREKRVKIEMPWSRELENFFSKIAEHVIPGEVKSARSFIHV